MHSVSLRYSTFPQRTETQVSWERITSSACLRPERLTGPGRYMFAALVQSRITWIFAYKAKPRKSRLRGEQTSLINLRTG